MVYNINVLKEIFHIDNLVISLISCIFYGLGFFYPDYFGANKYVSIAISLVVGMIGDVLAKKIILSDFVQRKPSHRITVFLLVYINFIIANIVAIRLIGYSFSSDYVSSFIWSCAITFITFVISMIRKELIAYKSVLKLGTGGEGIKYDEDDIRFFKNETVAKDVKIEPKDKVILKTKTGVYYTSKKFAYKKIIAFHNIRYAKKLNRWQKAEMVDETNEEFNATCFGPSLLQRDRETNIAKYHQQSEDALSLDVYKRLGNSKRILPVFVCFHGGDFESGSSAFPIYYGYDFVKENECIYITVNYRFGLLGFADFREVEGSGAYQDTPYLGLYDQLLALQWIKENVACFGGDKDNITVFSSSMSAHCMTFLASKNMLNGLANRVCVISPLLNFKEDGTNMKLVTSSLMSKFNCHNMQDLLNLSSENLKDFINNYEGDFCGPLADDSFLPSFAYKEFAEGASKNLEFLIGINAEGYGQLVMTYGEKNAKKLYDELEASISDNAEDKYIYRSFNEFVEISKKEGKTYDEAIADLGNYVYNILPNVLLGQRIAKGGGKAFIYVWNERSFIKKFGSSSYSLIAAILNNDKVANKIGLINTSVSSKMVEKMTYNFSQNGDPSLLLGDVLHIEPIKFEPCTKANLNIALFENNTITFENISIIKKIKVLEKEFQDIVMYQMGDE